jgi:hypothetical protein
MMRARRFALVALLGASGCATGSQTVRKANATFAIDATGPCPIPSGAQATPASCPISDARIYIDERFVGRSGELAARPVPVIAGPLRVEVRADGFFTAYRDAEVRPGESARLKVELRRVPEGEPGG